MSTNILVPKQPTIFTNTKISISTSIYDKIDVILRQSPVFPSDSFDIKTIHSILETLHTKSSGKENEFVGEKIPILNIEIASTSDLKVLLHLFTPEILEDATIANLKELLTIFIPLTTLQNPPSSKYKGTSCATCALKPKWFQKKFDVCYWCSRPFCINCSLRKCCYLRIGSDLHNLCNECIADLTREDAADWAKSSITFLAKTEKYSVMASIGCAFMALSLGADPHVLFLNIAKELHAQNKHDLAYCILSSDMTEGDINHSITEIQKMKKHLLVSSILLSLAKNETLSTEEQWKFALASREIYQYAAEIASLKGNIELDNRLMEIDKRLDIIEEKEIAKHNKSVMQHTKAFEALWIQKDIPGLLTYLKENTSELNPTAIIQEDPTLIAFIAFCKNKATFMSKMMLEDKLALSFLEGVLKLKQGNIEDAFSSIEFVSWNQSISTVPNGALFGVILHIMSRENATLFCYPKLKKIFQNGLKELLLCPSKQQSGDRITALLFPSDSELTPPFEANWPSLSVVGHNSICHKKYEEAVLKLYHEKKWSRLQVAWAYIDEYPGCEHPSEMAVCYLHAAMWIVSTLKPNSRIESNTFYGLKCVVMRLLQTAYAITFKVLNPGMELYVIRLIIGMMRKIAQMPGSRLVLSDEDLEFLLILLKRLEKVSRLFPFWNPPKVSISEAVMFNIITRKLHSNFILGLQDIEREHCPLTSIDLKYQLYENDLRCLLPLDNPTDCRARAMEELLQSQGLSWNDVAHTMSSKLTPRDVDGWIIQSTTLGIPQKYAEITGFVIDIDSEHPSIELLVVEANQTNQNNGLFSHDDVNVMLQLESSDYPLFFSLDSPNHDLDKQYHPFQQWRYATEKIKDTEVLNTMFITDYMMKSFTVGSDVSSLPPFKQRPCKDGLTKNLPPHLQQAIRSIRERGGFHSQSSHRFWIEAKEMKYDCQQNGSKIAFYFGEMEMIVKSHALNRRTDGELDDTDEDDDPNSPEAQFAKDMTNHYEELSIFFPQFARLRQLSKLQIFAMFLDSVLQSLKDISEGKNTELQNKGVKDCQEDARKQHHTIVTTILTSKKDAVGIWPKAENTSYVQSKAKKEILSSMRRYHINNSDLEKEFDKIKYHILSDLQDDDKAVLDEITRDLKGYAKIHQDYKLEKYVRKWLAEDSQSNQYTKAQEELVEILCHHLPIPKREDILREILDYHRQKYRTLQNLCSRFRIKTLQVPNACEWVPAAISNEGFAISYGGVAFTPKVLPVREGEVLPRPIGAVSVPITNSTTISDQPPCCPYAAPDDYAKPKEISDWCEMFATTKLLEDITRGIPKDLSSIIFTMASNIKSQAKKALKITTQVRVVTEERPNARASSTPPPLLLSSGEESPLSTAKGIGGNSPPGGGPPPSGGSLPGEGSSSGGSSSNDSSSNNESPRSSEARKSARKLPEKLENLTWRTEKLPHEMCGIYILRNKKTGKVYVGKSIHIRIRIREHKCSIKNDSSTIGRQFESLEDLVYAVFELPEGKGNKYYLFYEQSLLNDVIAICGRENVMNIRRCLNIKDYNDYKLKLPPNFFL